MKLKTFRNHDGRGFMIKFPNGVTLSTQFAWGNYCSNYDSILPIKEEMTKKDWESDDAEIAIVSPDGEWLTRQFKDVGDVLGYVKIDEWLRAFDWARNYRPPPSKETKRD